MIVNAVVLKKEMKKLLTNMIRKRPSYLKRLRRNLKAKIAYRVARDIDLEDLEQVLAALEIEIEKATNGEENDDDEDEEAADDNEDDAAAGTQQKSNTAAPAQQPLRSCGRPPLAPRRRYKKPPSATTNAAVGAANDQDADDHENYYDEADRTMLVDALGEDVALFHERFRLEEDSGPRHASLPYEEFPSYGEERRFGAGRRVAQPSSSSMPRATQAFSSSSSDPVAQLDGKFHQFLKKNRPEEAAQFKTLAPNKRPSDENAQPSNKKQQRKLFDLTFDNRLTLICRLIALKTMMACNGVSN